MAVNDAVVDGQRHIGHGPHKDRVLPVHLAHDDALFELANAEDRRLTLVQDDRRGEQRPGYAVVRDRETTSRYVLPFQLPFAGTPGEIV